MQLLAGLEVHVRLSGLEIMPPFRLLLHDVRRGAQGLDRSSPYPMQDTSDTIFNSTWIAMWPTTGEFLDRVGIRVLTMQRVLRKEEHGVMGLV
jgi:hypothetical protein